MSSAGSGQKPLKLQPKNSTRRSKEEREERAKEENERKKQRQAASAAEERAEAANQRGRYGFPSRGPRGGRGRGEVGAPMLRRGRGGRGGFMGQHPLPLDGARDPTSGAALRSRGGPQPRRGNAGTTRRTAKQKRSDALSKPEQDVDGDVSMLATPNLKTEPQDGGAISSDSDRRQKNIDFINISSDESLDEADSDTATGAAKPAKSKSRGPRANGYNPIRLQRKEHVDRVVGINTEASSATAAELRRTSDDGRGDHVAGSLGDALASAAKKGKVRSRDVDFIGKARRWKGVYEDERDQDDFFQIKQEPSDDVTGVDTTTAAAAAAAAAAAPVATASGARDDGAAEQPEPLSSDADDKAASRTKLRRRRQAALARGRDASFQTEEERREWAIHQQKLQVMRQELGANDAAPPTGEDTGDAETAPGSAAGAGRTDTVYLFQMPPVLPSLRVPSAHPDAAADADDVDAMALDALALAPIKSEDSTTGAGVSASAKPAAAAGPAPAPDASKRAAPAAPAGRVGTLRVHASGRASLTWGGASLAVGMGVDAYFLQTAVLTRLPSSSAGASDLPPSSSAAAAAAAAAGGKEEGPATSRRAAGASAKGKQRARRSAAAAAVEEEPARARSARDGAVHGEAISFGQIRGKMVVVPDWEELLA